MGDTSAKLASVNVRVAALKSGYVAPKAYEWTTIFTPSEGKTPFLVWFMPQHISIFNNAWLQIKSGDCLVFNTLLGSYRTNQYNDTVYRSVIGEKNKALEILVTDNAVKFNYLVGEIDTDVLNVCL
jgi:hypothetical protein